jgi:proline dehydrogenase
VGGCTRVCRWGAKQASIEKALAGMEALGLEPTKSSVYFGQLLGMADHLTLSLGRHGYKAYKYVNTETS